MAGDLDDEYVANLLKQDAKKATKTYELVGIDAFNPKRLHSGAPKPNTNFLRHIIRQTDSHNAALLAKEAEDSHARLKSMNREQERAKRRDIDKQQKKAEGRLTPVPSDEDVRQKQSKREQRRHQDAKDHDSRRSRRGRDSLEARTHRRRRDSSEEAYRRKRRHEDDDEGSARRKRQRSRSSHERDRQLRYASEEEHKRPTRKERADTHRSRWSHSRSNSGTRSRSRTPRPDKHRRRHRSHDRSHSPRQHSEKHKSSHTSVSSRQSSRRYKRRSASPTSGSDPLEAIVGPLPPTAKPTVQARGRGAHKANSMGIESRFSTTYNPSVDVSLDADVEDDWGDALEALRGRQQWQQLGATRLKAAGYSEKQVKKWEKGEEQTEEDVVWTSKGQAREWDRGKVIDEDGVIDLKADFGRLT